MTLDLARLKSLHAAATQGEWKLITNSDPEYEYPDFSLKYVQSNKNDDYIVALHNAAQELIARAELLEEMLPRLEHSAVYFGHAFITAEIACTCNPSVGYSCEECDARASMLNVIRFVERYRALEADNGKH